VSVRALVRVAPLPPHTAGPLTFDVAQGLSVTFVCTVLCIGSCYQLLFAAGPIEARQELLER
jgi:hypothetical protein